MNYTVINRDNMLHIIDEDAFPVCHLDYLTLQSLSVTDESYCSACIFHLASFGVLPCHTLYQVASFIEKHYPELHIDWFTTFYHVEKNSYLRTSFLLKEMLEGNDYQDERSRITRFRTFEENKQVDCLDTALLKIVMMNIISFDVKVN